MLQEIDCVAIYGGLEFKIRLLPKHHFTGQSIGSGTDMRNSKSTSNLILSLSEYCTYKIEAVILPPSQQKKKPRK
jgi:hypothetical protein